MAFFEPYLADLWISIIAFFLLYYAAVDGVVLGMGMLTLSNPEGEERDVMIGALLSTWHSNQTWLVIVGGMMFGAFPLFYGILLSALYVPVFGMLFGFIVRGMALDYWAEAARKRPWEMAFGLGSLLTSVAQGFTLGGLLGGIHVDGGRFSGGIMDWATPFSGFVAAGVIIGYLMLASNFMVAKMEGRLQQRGYRYALITALLTLAASVGTYAWLLEMHPRLQERWTTLPAAYYVLPFPALALAGFFALIYCLRKRYEKAPLLLNVAVIIFSFAGISLGFYPHMIPNVVSEAVTVSGAAAAPQTLMFMLVVVGVMLPVILAYTSYEFWIFRGKVSGYYKKTSDPDAS
jgi:cytochrome bd ubiquinol oxidase subunit II